MMMTRERYISREGAVAIMRHAADWLEANPDRHITDDMALTKDGVRCATHVPDAYCFCAVGRIRHEVKELGIYRRPFWNYFDRLSNHYAAERTLVSVNDCDGQVAAIKLMRQYADQAEQRELD